MKKNVMAAFFCILLLLSACGKKSEQIAIVEKPNDNKIFIYRPTDDGIVADKEMYQVKQPDSLSAAVEETMSAVTADGGDVSVAYHTYMLDAKNNLSLDFFAEEEVDSKRRLLAHAAICQTLFQLSGINTITIRVMNENEEVLVEDTFTRESFYYYDYEEEAFNIREITIYYPNKEGTALSRSTVKVRQELDKTIPEQIVSVLASRGVIPSDTTLNNVYFSSGICYLDFKKSFMDFYPSTEGKLVIYSLVNSITELDGVEAVYLLVNGEEINNYNGFEEVGQALSYDESIVK